MRTMTTAHSLLLSFILSVFLMGFAATTAQALTTNNAKICVLMFANVDDLGWSFSVNVGRLRTKERLNAMFPSVAIETFSYPNSFFDYPTQDDKDTLWRNVVESGCSVVVSIGCCYFDAATGLKQFPDKPYDSWHRRARKYDNMTFLVMWDDPLMLTNYSTPNLNFFIIDQTSGYYLAGVAAAHQAKTCAGIMVPFDWNRNSHDAASGFVLGMQAANPTTPVHVITIESFFAPWNELEVVKLFTEQYGCEVVARYSDPRDVDVYIQSQRAKGLMSIGAHADLQHYVGDTVLASVYVDWDEIFVPLIADVINYGQVQATRRPLVYGVASGALKLSPISPAAHPEVKPAVLAAAASLAVNDNPICSGMTTNWGVDVSTTYAAGTNCRELTATLPGIVLTPSTVYHGAFPRRTNCPDGTNASYTVDPKIELVCSPCPANTFALAGAITCTPCPLGQVAAPKSANCSRELLTQTDATVPIAITVSVLGAVAIGMLLFFSRVRYRGWVKNKLAPKEPPLCILFTDVESSTMLWNQYPKAMEEALDVHNTVIREVIAEHAAYEVKTVGDSFMIACVNALDGATLAVDIQLALQAATWPSQFAAEEKHPLWNGLKVRISVHQCVDVQPKYEGLHNYWDYYGNGVNVAARVESKAVGGQICLTEDTWSQVQHDALFDSALGPNVVVVPWADAVTLKGLESKVKLYSMVPSELRGRKFPPLTEGMKPSHVNQVVEETHETNDAETISIGSTEALSRQGAFGDLSSGAIFFVVHSMMAQITHPEAKRKIIAILSHELNINDIANQKRAIAMIGTELWKRVSKRARDFLSDDLQIEDVSQGTDDSRSQQLSMVKLQQQNDGHHNDSNPFGAKTLREVVPAGGNSL